MTIYSYHLVKVSLWMRLKLLFNLHRLKRQKGLLHIEVMSSMVLGSPIFSLSRLKLRDVVIFAQWEGECVLDYFLIYNKVGRTLAKGEYLKLKLIRQWGNVSGFVPEKLESISEDQSASVVAVTVARMKFLQIPRFIKWGRPVEMLVRDHPGVLFARASIGFPHTVSTFSLWNTQKDMLDMVKGHGKVDEPNRHIDAMKERERKDFHYEFTTLRFSVISASEKWGSKVKE